MCCVKPMVIGGGGVLWVFGCECRVWEDSQYHVLIQCETMLSSSHDSLLNVLVEKLSTSIHKAIVVLKHYWFFSEFRWNWWSFLWMDKFAISGKNNRSSGAKSESFALSFRPFIFSMSAKYLQSYCRTYSMNVQFGVPFQKFGDESPPAAAATISKLLLSFR